MRLNTILIGAQKAGTSSLYDWIGQHPEVCAPEIIKDYHYFTVQKLQDIGYDFIEKALIKEQKEKAKVYMQGGVNYIFQDDAPKAIATFDPNMRLVLILRNPVDRAISAYRYFKQLGQEELSFEKAIHREHNNELLYHAERMNYTYIEHGFYYKQIMNYLNYFEKDQLKVILFEDLKDSPEKVCRELFSFLGIATNYIPNFKIKNTSGKALIPGINKLFFGSGKITTLIRGLAKVIPFRLRVLFVNWVREFNKSTKKSDHENLNFDRETLNKYYVQDVKKLSDLLGIDLSTKWGIE